MNRRTVFAAVLVCLLPGSVLAHEDSSPAGGPFIVKQVEVAAPPGEVWNAWTTEEGAKTFFARSVNIDATVGGHYEIFFSPDQPYGFRGADGSKVHDIVDGRLLVFTWNAPPEFGVLRNLRTLVYVRLEKTDSGGTRVTMHHIGFGESPEWVKLHKYFSKAWGVVLSRLQHRFEHGPLEWDNPPPVGPTSSEAGLSDGKQRADSGSAGTNQ